MVQGLLKSKSPRKVNIFIWIADLGGIHIVNNVHEKCLGMILSSLLETIEGIVQMLYHICV